MDFLKYISICILLVHQGGSDLNITFIEMELSWSNAKDYCFTHGGILESNPVELTQRYNGHEDYWTGTYSNTGWSEWAVVWGCYFIPINETEASEFDNNNKSLCQRNCPQYDFFAIKGTKCYCFNQLPSTSVDYSMCRCDECDYITIFRQNIGEVQNSLGTTAESLLTCLSAQCENRNLVLRSDNCQLAYQGICDNGANIGFETQQGASRRCSARGSHLKWYEPDFCPRPGNRQNQLWTSATREISTLNVTQHDKYRVLNPVLCQYMDNDVITLIPVLRFGTCTTHHPFFCRFNNVETTTNSLSTEQSTSTETISYSIGSSTEALASSTESAGTSSMASTTESEGTSTIANTTESAGANSKASSADMGPSLETLLIVVIIGFLLVMVFMVITIIFKQRKRKSKLNDLKHEKLHEIPVSEDIVLNDFYSIALPLNDKQTVNFEKKNNTVKVPKEILSDDIPIRSGEGIYSLAEAMYDGTDAELNRYERPDIDAQYTRPDDYIYSFAELVYDDPTNDQSPKPNCDPGKQPLYDTVPAIQHEATSKHSERQEPVSQEEIGNSNGLIEIFSNSCVKDDQKHNDIYVYDKLHEGEKRLKTDDSFLYDHARSLNTLSTEYDTATKQNQQSNFSSNRVPSLYDIASNAATLRLDNIQSVPDTTLNQDSIDTNKIYTLPYEDSGNAAVQTNVDTGFNQSSEYAIIIDYEQSTLVYHM